MTTERQIQDGLARLQKQRDAVGDPNQATTFTERAHSAHQKRVAETRLAEAWNVGLNGLPQLRAKLDTRVTERRELRRRRSGLEHQRAAIGDATTIRNHVDQSAAWGRTVALDDELRQLTSDERIVSAIIADLQERQHATEQKLAALLAENRSRGGDGVKSCEGRHSLGAAGASFAASRLAVCPRHGAFAT